jgi:hypothetical protein
MVEVRNLVKEIRELKPMVERRALSQILGEVTKEILCCSRL